MWRYLKEAFWAKADFPGVGPLPVNALAVLGLGVFGCVEHPLWLLGLGLETAYLYALTSNPRFRKVIQARANYQSRQTAEQTRQDFLARLSPEARARLDRLEAKIRRAVTLTRGDETGSLLADSNLDALEKLGDLHLRLLVAEQDLQTVRQQTDEAALSRQTAALEKELSATDRPLSSTLRESKQATLELTRKRLANAARRTETLAEVASDLARIEAQIDLALDDTGLDGKPAAVSGNLNLLNRILESNTALRADTVREGSALGFSAPAPRPREFEG